MTDISGLTAMVPVIVGGAVVYKVADAVTRKQSNRKAPKPAKPRKRRASRRRR